VAFLITGGAGFIGSHLAARLVEQGQRVRVLDNFFSGHRHNLAAIGGDVEVIEGDIRDEVTLRRAVAGVETVFHQAAVASVPRSIADPRLTFDANVTGTLGVLLAARDAGCSRVVFASSSSVYGDTPVMPKVETMRPNPLSPYAISKLSGEQLCGVFTTVYGLETVALRYFNVFGPRQDPLSEYAAVIPKFLRALRLGEAPTIFGDGEQSRDFTYVENVVQANLKAARTPGAAGSVLNIAAGRATTINAMFSQLARLTGGAVQPVYQPARPGDIRDSLADIRAAQETIGYDVEVPFDEGLERTVEAALSMPMAAD